MMEQRMEPGQPHGRLTDTGMAMEVTPARQASAGTALEAAEDYARKSQTHLWLLLITYKVPDAFLDAQDGLKPKDDPTAILDPDAILGVPALVCYLCEQPYDRRLRHRRCPGEPR